MGTQSRKVGARRAAVTTRAPSSSVCSQAARPPGRGPKTSFLLSEPVRTTPSDQAPLAPGRALAAQRARGHGSS